MTVVTKFKKRGPNTVQVTCDGGSIGHSWYADKHTISLTVQVYNDSDDREMASRIMMSPEECAKLGQRLLDASKMESPK